MDDQRAHISRKSFEISYALLRIARAAAPRSAVFSSYLESYAFDLLDRGVVPEREGGMETVLTRIEHFLILSADMGYAANSSIEIVLKEARELNAAISSFDNAARLPDSEIMSIFSDKNAAIAPTIEANSGIMSVPDEGNAATLPYNAATVAAFNSANFDSRKSAILEKIRETTNCRMRDILSAVPNTSERTVRYDIQRLIEQGLIERVGVGGPNVQYCIRD